MAAEVVRPEPEGQRQIVHLPAALWLAVAGYGALAQPEIKTQPADTSVSLGATAQLTVSVYTTAPPLTYQWWFNDTALDPVANPSAARARLSLTNVTLGNAGSYSVVISDASGSIKSRMATLDVDPQFTKLTQGPVVTDPVRGMSGKFGDYDGDGRLDLAFMGNYWHVGNNARLYHNEGNGQFSTVTTSPWGSLSDRVSFSAWADTDNDGDLDLFLAANENDPPVFLRNDGGGAFTRFTVDKSWTSNEVLIRGGTSAWGDFDNDGLLDAVVGNGSTTHLLHNSRDGTFTRLTGGSSDLGGPGWTDTFDWVDYDHDGDLDLFVAKEDALSRLYRNDGLSRFTDVTLTVLQGRVGQGFGGAWGDYDNDGDMDLIFVGREGPGRFLINDGDGTFSDWSGSPHAMLSVANGLPVWGDYDNDGHLDLLITQYGSHSRLFRSLGDGCFVEVTVGSLVNDPTPGSMNPAEPSVITAAWADYDNDGDLDVFVACDQSTGNYLYENNGNGNHWLKLRLHGTVSNRSAVGARVSVQAAIGGKSSRQLRQVTAQSAVQELEVHFGLGDATVAEVIRVEWPSGNVQELSDQAVDRVLEISEPLRIQPPRPSASLGGAVTLNGLGTGTYQWRFNGVDLAGETKRTLTLTNLQATQQGRYSLVVTAVEDTRTMTNHAYLTIDTQFTKITEGAAATERGCSWISSCGDYDNDGNPDLAVLRYPASQSAVYRNNGDGTFTTVPDIPWNTGQGYSWGLWGDFD
ncbi:MAG: VCBS repeat-containing protein, partial [Verrucomicrobiales bacterium]|nr:VCBS repeat-containing protein [Verrucomicrobiales bacterium]